MNELNRRNIQALAQQVNDVDLRVRKLQVDMSSLNNAFQTIMARIDLVERRLALRSDSGPTEK